MRLLIGGVFWLGLIGIGARAPAESELAAYLDECGRRYSEEHAMLGQNFHSPGYHTTIPSGTWAHPVVPSLDYALGLLNRDSSGDRDRAIQVLRKVIGLQDIDPASPTYGIWPWLLEEPLAKMSPPDWNWADFCGARLAVILHDHAAALPEDVKQSVRASLGHAAQAIKKRNVGPGYTNIAIMGGGVCAAAGELLANPTLLEYGRQRLEQIVAHTAHHGSFNEYNSPTYTMVALWESERTLHLVQDPATRMAAESLRRTAWQMIAESYHPGTHQWAGPHARSYSDHLFGKVTAYLAKQTESAIPLHPSSDASRLNDLPVAWHLPCPEDLKARFRALPSDPYEVRRTFLRGATPAGATTGTTWLTADACLGSVNRGTFWTQCRPLIGYWKTESDPAVVLRLRFLHDGRDFASMGVNTAQSGAKCLALVYPLRNQGDWHPGLDRPKDGVFQATDFRLRIELAGKGVTVEELGPASWALRAGRHRAVVHTLPGRFASHEIVWKPGTEAGRAFVDAVCYQGDLCHFSFRPLPEVVLGVGIELLPVGESSSSSPRLTQATSRIEGTWDIASGLNVAAPLEMPSKK